MQYGDVHRAMVRIDGLPMPAMSEHATRGRSCATRRGRAGGIPFFQQLGEVDLSWLMADCVLCTGANVHVQAAHDGGRNSECLPKGLHHVRYPRADAQHGAGAQAVFQREKKYHSSCHAVLWRLDSKSRRLHAETLRMPLPAFRLRVEDALRIFKIVEQTGCVPPIPEVSCRMSVARLLGGFP